MDPSKRREMQQLVSRPVSAQIANEALGIFSKPPGENSGPSHDEEELADLSADLDILNSVLDQVEKLNAGSGKQKLKSAVESYISQLEQQASAVDRKLKKQRR